jgi:CRP-like cAMP-binding protein
MQAFGKARAPIKNQILAALPAQELEQMLAKFESVSLHSNQVLYNPGEDIAYLYFPDCGLISFVATMIDGTTVEVGMVGSEGIAGVPVLLGSNSMPYRASVQVRGHARRMRTDVFKDEIQRHSAFQHWLLRYAQSLLIQAAQTAACNRLHTVEERLCRWLLMVHDRLDSNEFLLTHEVIAKMLGSRRAGITVAAGMLQRAGMINYIRGRIQILNRSALESSACECYRIIRAESNCSSLKK